MGFIYSSITVEMSETLSKTRQIIKPTLKYKKTLTSAFPALKSAFFFSISSFALSTYQFKSVEKVRFSRVTITARPESSEDVISTGTCDKRMLMKMTEDVPTFSCLFLFFQARKVSKVIRVTSAPRAARCRDRDRHQDEQSTDSVQGYIRHMAYLRSLIGPLWRSLHPIISEDPIWLCHI